MPYVKKIKNSWIMEIKQVYKKDLNKKDIENINKK
jgi:uncharacterized protein YlbG (UPF0298 family)